MTQIEQLRQAAELWTKREELYQTQTLSRSDRDAFVAADDAFRYARDNLDFPSLLAELEQAERMREAWDELERRLQNTASTLCGAHVNSNDLLGRILRNMRALKEDAARTALAQPSGGGK